MHVDTLLAVVEADGRVRDVNPVLCQWSGRSTTDWIGNPIWSVVAVGEEMGRLQNAIQRAAGGESTDGQIGLWVATNGRAVPVRWSLLPLTGHSGLVDGIVVAAQSLGNLEQLRSELDDALGHYQILLDISQQGVITLNEAGRIQSFSHAAERLFGYRALEVLGKEFTMLLPPSFRAEHNEYIERCLATGRTKVIGDERRVHGLHKDGRIFPISLTIGDISLGRQRLLMGVFNDVTDSQRIQLDALRRHDALLDRLLAQTIRQLVERLSFEISQPAQAIVSLSQACQRLLRHQAIETESLYASLEKTVQSSKDIAMVLAQYSNSGDRTDDRIATFDLADCIKAAVRALQHELDANEIHLSMKLPASIPMLTGDRSQIAVLVLNLIRNAVQALSAHDCVDRNIAITVFIAPSPKALQISICDNGPGIDSGRWEHLFEPFHTTRRQGLGLGLWTCQRIAQAHGGSVWAEPNRPGGATFHVSLPVQECTLPGDVPSWGCGPAER